MSNERPQISRSIFKRGNENQTAPSPPSADEGLVDRLRKREKLNRDYGFASEANLLKEAADALVQQPAPNFEHRFNEMLIGIIDDIQNELGFSDDEKECSNGSLEIVEAIRQLKRAAQLPTYSLDADPAGIRERTTSAALGALAFGAQNTNPPPDGHWLQQFWDIGRADAEQPAAKAAATAPNPLPPELEGTLSPMAEMAEALRRKAEIERERYEDRRQSGEWGPAPDAGTQADFCPSCDGSGWDGESRTDLCPACNGGREPEPRKDAAPAPVTAPSGDFSSSLDGREDNSTHGCMRRFSNS